ncbi:NAD(P)-binding protein [Ramaria rubella]|nr:NAD(P)-binding protein [Ramaria rubella]
MSFDSRHIFAPPPPRHFTATTHHDVYSAISPSKGLSGSAQPLSVLITGAGRGVGRAAAITFSIAGAKKVVLTSRSRDQLDEVAQAIEEAVGQGNVQVIKVVGDVTKREDVERLFDHAGEVDVLINNAGSEKYAAAIHESDPDEWWKTQEINMKGTYLPTREFLRRNLGRPLTLINTSSAGSVFTYPGLSSYQPGKTLINRFTEFIHFEYQGRDVRTFAYHPGGILTNLAENLPQQTKSSLIDSPELAGGFLLWLSTQGEKVDFLRGRYDVDELLSMKEEILQKDLLWTRVVGQEQGKELIELQTWGF